MSFTVDGTSGLTFPNASTQAVAAANQLKYITDTTDITLVNIASSYVTVGSSFSVSIPTTGYINITSFAGRLTWSSVADNISCIFGIRIGSTNYWFGKWSGNGTIYYTGLLTVNQGAGEYTEYYGSLIKYAYPVANGSDAAPLSMDIAANSVPTGTQTVQLIAAYPTLAYTGIGILKGTTTTTRVGIEFVSAS